MTNLTDNLIKLKAVIDTTTTQKATLQGEYNATKGEDTIESMEAKEKTLTVSYEAAKKEYEEKYPTLEEDLENMLNSY